MNTPGPKINRACEPECSTCKGAGIIPSPPQIEKNIWGKDQEVIRWGPCPENAKVKLLRQSGLNNPEMKFTWDKILDIKNTFEAMHAIQDVLAKSYGWVYLWGGSGNAKTDLLKTAVAEHVHQNKNAAYVNMVNIIDDLRGAFDKDYPSVESQSRLDRWQSIPLLSIDEFNRVNETPWVEERKFVLMDERYRAAINKQGITLMASNVNPDTFDPYLYSRIEDGHFKIIKMTAKSLRPAMQYPMDD